ncbi:MAG: hypothetical protein CSA29_02760 [Desulfobacterales bacterium]|nr:MAG: hypothetical protein CSA29_02760 [Desulfobacterales bacterium]
MTPGNEICLTVPLLYSIKIEIKKEMDTKINELYRQIGNLKVENDFLSGKLIFLYKSLRN